MKKINKYILSGLYISLIGLFKVLEAPTFLNYGISICFLLIIAFYYKKSTVILIYSIFCPYYPIRLATLGLVIIYECIKNIKGKKLELKNVKKILLYQDKELISCSILLTFYVFCILSFVINQFISFNIMSIFAYSLTMISSTVAFLVFYFTEKEEKDLCIREYITLTTMQLIPVIMILIKAKFTGKFHQDYVMGTFSNANQLSIALIVVLILTILDNKICLKEKLTKSIVYILIISITDAKHVWAAFMLAIVVLVLFWPMKKSKIKIIKNILIVFICIVGFIFGIQYLTKSNVDIYVYNENVNLKYQAYEYTFTQVKFPEILIGRGPGTYGSRAANALAYEYMYKTEDSVRLPTSIPSIINADYKYIATLFTKEYMDNIKFYSAILSYPISNYVTLYGELGMIGIIIVLMFAIVNVRSSMLNIKNGVNIPISVLAIVLIGFVGLVMFIDNYLEINEFMVMLIMVIAFSDSSKKVLLKGEK